MTNSYVFMTDSDSDLPYELADEWGIPVVKMPYVLDGVEYFDENGREGVEKQRALFQRMREGSAPSTSQLPTEAYLEYFEPILKEKDLLFISFSSRMSSTLNNVKDAREQLLQKYPGRKFRIVDTMSISAPMTLLLCRAHELYEQGASIEEVAEWVEKNRFRAHGWFTVDDLVYLKRGGRITPTSAVFGTLLDIKPILCEGLSGKIDAAEKVQGRRKAMRVLVDKVEKYIEHPEEQELIVLHADCIGEAERLAAMVKERIPAIRSIRIGMVGPVIGAHCGPGTLSCSFMGKERDV